MATFLSFELWCIFKTNNFKCLSSTEIQNNTWNHGTQEFLTLSPLPLLLFCLLFSLTVRFHFFFLLPLFFLQSISHNPLFSFCLPLFGILLMPLFIPAVSLLMNWLAIFFPECSRHFRTASYHQYVLKYCILGANV